MPEWVLSGYEEVLAALKEPRLVQTGDAGLIDGEQQRHKRQEVLDALPAAKLNEWQERIAPLAREILDTLPEDRPVELVAEFLRPWCDGIAGVVMTESVKPLALGLTDTLPAFLANALFALLHSGVDLRHVDASPRAVEELLRHAGTVHTLVRTATADLDLGGLRMAQGDRVILKLALANHDPGRFAEPERLDLERRQGGHLALGAGAHACAGAMAIRMAAQVMLDALKSAFAAMELAGEVEWHRGSTKDSPDTLPVRLVRAPAP